MELDLEVVNYIAKTFYDLSPEEGSIKALCGYTDKNYTFTVKNGDKLVLKIVLENPGIESLTDIIDEVMEKAYGSANEEFLLPKVIRTSANKSSAMATIRVKDLKTNDYKDLLCNFRLVEFYPSITMEEFINKRQDLYQAREFYTQTGRFCSELCRQNKSNCHLVKELKKIRQETKFIWSTISEAESIIEKLGRKFYPIEADNDRAVLLKKMLQEYRNCQPEISKLPEYVIHGDLSGSNILIHERYLDKRGKIKFCLIDFQDLQVGPQVLELSNLMLYNILEQHMIDYEDALIQIPRWTLQGFQGANQSTKIDSKATLKLVPTLMKLRLAQSLLIGLEAHEDDPANDYVLKSNVRGWYLLKLLVEEGTIYSNSSELLSRWLA